MAFGEMPFGEMTFSEVTFGDMAFGEMTFGESSGHSIRRYCPASCRWYSFVILSSHPKLNSTLFCMLLYLPCACKPTSLLHTLRVVCNLKFDILILKRFLQEIALHNCHELIQNIDMFRNAHSDFIYEIISLLEFQVYLPGEYITYAGNYASLFKNWTVA